MKTSEKIGSIVSALLKAQTAMGAATKGSTNPYFDSKYADFNSVLKACKDILNENKIVILQSHFSNVGETFVETQLIHESGEWISSETKVVVAKENDPQAFGSALTYARRYGLQSLVAIPTEDDDANQGAGRAKSTASSTSERKYSSFRKPNVPVSTNGTNGTTGELEL